MTIWESIDYDAWFEEIEKHLCNCDNPIKGKLIAPVVVDGEKLGDYGTVCQRCGKFISIESD